MDPQQLAASVAASVFEKEMNLRKAFNRYDTDGDGTIDKKEFGKVMGQFSASGDTDAVFDLFDGDGSGRISCQEFQNALMDFGGSAPPPPSSRMRRDMHLEQNAPVSRGGGGGGGGGFGGGGGIPREAPRTTGSLNVKGAIAQAAEYEDDYADADSLSDAEVMNVLSDRLAEEGVPLHTLFRVLCPAQTADRVGGGGSGTNRLALNTGGLMSEAGLRDLIGKMGLAGTLASPAEEAAAAKTGQLQAAVGRQHVQTQGSAHGMTDDGTYKPSAIDGTMGNSRSTPLSLKADGTINTLGNSLGAGVADSVGRSMAYNESEQRAGMVLQSGDASDEAVRSLLPLIQAKMYEHGFDTGSVRELFLKIDADRSGRISPREFFDRMANWGVQLSPEQCLHLLEPFDVDMNGEIDYTEFCRWVAMWSAPEGDGESGQWYKGGEIDKRVWAAAGSGTGRIGRLHRLMQMIDVDHNGGVECWEFIKALSKGDDYDRAVDGSSSKGGGLGSGRLNADGTLKDCYKKNFHVPTENPLGEDEAIALLMMRMQKSLHEGGPEVNGTFGYMLKRACGKNGMCNAKDLADVVAVIDVSTEGVLELVNKFGTPGADGQKQISASHLLHMLGEDADPGPAATPAPKFEMVQRAEEHPKVLRKKTDDELQQEELLRQHRKLQEEQQRLRDAEKKELTDLKDAAAADRLNPQVQNLSSTELKRVQMNDNAMVQQMRAELFERSSKMKDMFRRMDVNDSGSVSLIEFRKGLQRSGFTDSGSMHKKGLDRDALSVSIPDTVRLFNYFDEDGDGELSYHEFMRLLQDSMKVDYSNKMVVGENQDVSYSGAMVDATEEGSMLTRTSS